ncbi:MAG: heme-binding protein [Betaproteobacteria bacterium]|nr:heme-binding protein [Betaproteobacteria bacterium]MDE2309615.1 heme-binding protein [Betaproteobacteria bacterium]
MASSTPPAESTGTSKPVLTLADARRIAAAAETEALRNEWRVVIAVVDDGGHLLYLQRSHDTQFGSVETAICKARAAVAFQRPTKASEDAVLSGRLIHLALPGVIPAEGGVPLARDGHVIGGLGISGVRSFQDGQIAQAGADAISQN